MSDLDIKTQENDIERNKWRGRRKMGWMSLISMIVMTFALVFGMVPDERIKVLAEPLMWFYLAMTSVIGTYMGVTTYASLKGK